MKYVALFFAAIFVCSSVLAQTAPTYCHFIGSSIVQCNSPQGLLPVPKTIPSSPPGQTPGPLIFPQPYNQPSTGSNPPTFVQPLPLRSLGEATSPRLPTPSQTELESAYCVGVITQQQASENAYSEYLLRGASTETRNAARAVQEKMNQETNARLQRLKRYVFPILPYVDNGMLLAAVQQGKIDVENIASETKPCPQQCEHSSGSDMVKCYVTCNEMSEAYRHTKICQSLAFLPY